MRSSVGLVVSLYLLIPALSKAQYRVDPRNQHERVYAIVPMVGKGTADDPRRPAHLPLTPRGLLDFSSGILGFTMQLSDDGKLALVEFVARDRSAFAALLADKTPGVKAFEKGKVKKDDIEAEFKKVKKSVAESNISKDTLAAKFAEDDLKKYLQGDYPNQLKEAEAEFKKVKKDFHLDQMGASLP